MSTVWFQPYASDVVHTSKVFVPVETRTRTRHENSTITSKLNEIVLFRNPCLCISRPWSTWTIRQKTSSCCVPETWHGLMRFWCTKRCCERSRRSESTGTRTYTAEVVKILFPAWWGTPTFTRPRKLVFKCHVCHPLVRVFLAELPRPCIPWGTTEIKKIGRVRVYHRPKIFVQLKCLLSDLCPHFLNGTPATGDLRAAPFNGG